MVIVTSLKPKKTPVRRQKNTKLNPSSGCLVTTGCCLNTSSTLLLKMQGVTGKYPYVTYNFLQVE